VAFFVHAASSCRLVVSEPRARLVGGALRESPLVGSMAVAEPAVAVWFPIVSI
jgi:hypothetical protein